jgi:predicted Zn-dependent protease
VLIAMQAEIARHRARFATLASPRPYYLCYRVRDRHSVQIGASLGALSTSTRSHKRFLDVDLRVGDHRLDSTHIIRGERWQRYFLGRGEHSWLLPLERAPEVLRPTLWWAAHQAYERARERYLRVQGNRAVKTAPEDASDDFSRETKTVYLEHPGALELDVGAWETRLRAYSALFRVEPEVLESSVWLEASVTNQYLTTTEGSTVQTRQDYLRLSLYGEVRTADGMDISRREHLELGDSRRAPADAEVRRRIRALIDDLRALRRAPLAEPYVGPAVVDGLAAAVMFHEIFGHRVEGHRQKNDDEGQTFAKKIGTAIMPAFVDIYDDPTIQRLNGVDLNGFYRVDDEGVMARRVPLVERGVLRGFLMGRSPVRGFPRSNGHGRSQEGRAVVARQGNLIVHPTRTTSERALRQMLLAEIARQRKPYGLRLRLNEGGYTSTERHTIQSFKVRPVMVYRVYPDGREELIRGADIEGTPLTALAQILAAGDVLAVDNGHCGAESGLVPVSLASPSLLLARIEIARKAAEHNKLPALPPPGREEGGARWK